MQYAALIWRISIVLIGANAAIACENNYSSESVPVDGRAAHEFSVEQVLQRNLERVRTKPSGTKTENTDKILHINEADYSLVARYRAAADGFMRIDVFDGANRVFSEGIDELGIWQWPGDKAAPENVSHAGAEALKHSIEFNLFTLAELSDRGHSIEIDGRETILDKPYIVLKLTLSDGFETYRFVNTETWLVDISRDFRAFHPAVDSTKKNIETRYDQWSQADGVLFASRVRNIDLDSGEVIATTLVLESSDNRPREALDLPRSYVPTGAPR